VKSLVAFSFVPSGASTRRSLSPLHSRRDDGRLERMMPYLRRHDRQSCYPRRPWNGRNFVTITPTQGLASPQSRIGSLLGYVKDSMAPVWKSTQCGFADTIPKAADDHDYIGQHSQKVMRSVWASRKLMYKDRKRCAIGVYCVARIDMKQQLMQSGRVCL
jgi:hypothetical protein